MKYASSLVAALLLGAGVGVLTGLVSDVLLRVLGRWPDDYPYYIGAGVGLLCSGAVALLGPNRILALLTTRETSHDEQ